MYLQSYEVIITAHRKPFHSVFVPIGNPPFILGPLLILFFLAPNNWLCRFAYSYILCK